jgi:phosphoribosyl-ATP pyrophosphohydrolase
MTNFIDTLNALIHERKAHPQADSYTNYLLDNPNKAAQKVGEEATEVVIAALSETDDRLLEETADLLYHSLVLLATRNLSWEQLVACLETRHH